MVKYIEQKQQQEQQFQSLLPPELDTLTLHEGGLPNIKGGLPLLRPLEHVLENNQAMYSKGLNKGSPPLMFGSLPSWSVNVSSSGGSKL